MFFYILLFLPISITLIVALFLFIEEGFIDALFCLSLGLFVSFCFSVFPIFCWLDHSSDLGKIGYQDHLIEVYEKEVIEINKKLSGFDFPKGALMNNDTPVASIVNQLGVWQEKLAQSRAEKAKAILSIEARRHGPMSGVIGFVGDYK